MFPVSYQSWCLMVRVFIQTEHYHLPLLLQSFGVKWRHLGSIRKCLFCIALSCPSTISSESVRMYWPYRKNKSNTRRWTLCICSDQKPMFSFMFYHFAEIFLLQKNFRLLQITEKQNILSPEKSTLPVGRSSDWTDTDGFSPCNSWWGWGTGVLKWHLPFSHLWSHWSHWRLEKEVYLPVD